MWLLVLVGFVVVSVLIYKRTRVGRSECYWVTMDSLVECGAVDGVVNGRQLAAFLRRGYILTSFCRAYKADIVEECATN